MPRYLLLLFFASLPAPAADLARDALTRMDANQFAEAIPLLEQHLQVHPGDLSARNNYAVCLIKAKRFADAESQLRQVLEKASTRAGSRQNLGVALQGKGETLAALDETSTAIQQLNAQQARENLRAAALFNKGWLLDEQGYHGRAAEFYRLALQLRPSYPAATIALAIALAKSGEDKEAMLQLRNAIEITAKDDRLRRLAEYNLRLVGKPPQEPELSLRERLHPDHWAGWFYRSRLYDAFPWPTIGMYAFFHFLWFLLVKNLADVFFGRGRFLAIFLFTAVLTAAPVLLAWGMDLRLLLAVPFSGALLAAVILRR